jgi:hypothetical protein
VQSEKVEYQRERLLGIAKKLMNFHSDSQQPFALVFDFSALLVDNLKAISIKIVQVQAEKSNTSAKCSLGIANKFINFLAIPSKPFALVIEISYFIIQQNPVCS